MANSEKRIDVYIDKSAEFAQPILKYFRSFVHKTCPEVEEKIKWGFPHFDYKGGPMCSMAAFKKHSAITFWKAALMKNGAELIKTAKSEAAMGHLGKITSLKDLPSDKKLTAYIKEAMRLNEEGIKLSTKKNSASVNKAELPDYFLKALNKNKKAQKCFESFPPSHKKEYLQWITEAKSELTRNKRLKIALEWMSEGKDKNWKYKSG